jgi:hypothetical protein
MSGGVPVVLQFYVLYLELTYSFFFQLISALIFAFKPFFYVTSTNFLIIPKKENWKGSEKQKLKIKATKNHC